MKLKYLGIFGIISLLSYTAMVVFSPLAVRKWTAEARRIYGERY